MEVLLPAPLGNYYSIQNDGQRDQQVSYMYRVSHFPSAIETFGFYKLSHCRILLHIYIAVNQTRTMEDPVDYLIDKRYVRSEQGKTTPIPWFCKEWRVPLNRAIYTGTKQLNCYSKFIEYVYISEF